MEICSRIWADRFSREVIDRASELGLGYDYLTTTPRAAQASILPWQVAAFDAVFAIEGLTNAVSSPRRILNVSADAGCAAIHLRRLFPYADIRVATADIVMFGFISRNVNLAEYVVPTLPDDARGIRMSCSEAITVDEAFDVVYADVEAVQETAAALNLLLKTVPDAVVVLRAPSAYPTVELTREVNAEFHEYDLEGGAKLVTVRRWRWAARR